MATEEVASANLYQRQMKLAWYTSVSCVISGIGYFSCPSEVFKEADRSSR